MVVKVLLVLVGASLTAGLGPDFPASRGEVWPHSQHDVKEGRVYQMPSSFWIKLTNHSCPLINKAVKRYQRIYAQNLAPANFEVPAKRKFGDKIFNKLDYLQVVLTGPCEEWPYLGMDENYRLVVSARSKLTSASVWGILRGLESFAHLLYLYDDYKTILVNAKEICDYPHYQYRGLMLDTASHYISLDKILLTLGAMAMNKMNVFHWHLTNDDSFPFQSEKYPELSKKGAYYSSMVYTAADIARVIEYARERGIIVIPEISLPGNCASIHNSHPELFPICDHICGALDPSNNMSYQLAADLIAELQQRFPSNHVYLGAMDVDLVCWKDNPGSRKLMKEKNLTVQNLLNMFYQNIIKALKPGTVPVVWQDLWEKNCSVPNNTIFNVYREDGMHDIIRILTDGHRGILSFYYNLTGHSYGYNEFYADPLMAVRLELNDNRLLNNMLGAEFLAWTKNLDESNLISSVWPYACGFAEALWGYSWFPHGTVQVWRTPAARAVEHACRMRRRGLSVSPAAGPSFCVF